MTSWINASRRARLMGLLVLVATFLAGALAGAAATRVAGAREAPDVAPADSVRGHESKRGERGREGRGGRSERDLLERLDLTPEQKVQVDSILERGRAEMDAFWEVNRPRLRAIVESTREDIRQVLTPEQRVIEEQVRSEREAHHKRRHRSDSTETREKSR